MKLTINQMWNGMLDMVNNNIEQAVEWMKGDIKQFGIKNDRVDKLLNLASCPNSPKGEKENAAKMAFKYLVPYFN